MPFDRPPSPSPAEPAPNSADDSEPDYDVGMFEEPEGFRPPSPEPTFTSYGRPADFVRPGESAELRLRLTPKHSLWGHWVWNAGKVASEFIDGRPEFVRGKTVCELGAGAGLPSLLCLMKDATKVVITDYPEKRLLENLEVNVDLNFPAARESGRAVVQVKL